jgi:molybdopterin-guanine dinucleotide biosynthesis protein A
MRTKKPVGVVLAGGRSSRMGGGRKAFLELHGRFLLAHVVARFQTQVDTLLLSSEGETGDFDGFELPVVPDLLPGHRGPLTGLCSALQYLADLEHQDGLVLCPCDAPFIPDNLVATLLDAGQAKDKPVVVISYQGVLQPTFSLWQNHHLAVIRDAVVNQGLGGLKQVLAYLSHVVVEWQFAEPSPFFNINTPADLETAAQWLDRMHG